jgi:hypothetical protein
MKITVVIFFRSFTQALWIRTTSIRGSLQPLAGARSIQAQRGALMAAGGFLTFGVGTSIWIAKLNDRGNLMQWACAPGASNNGAAKSLFAPKIIEERNHAV